MATECRGPLWVDHTQEGTTYGLKHLHPQFIDFPVPEVPVRGNKPGRAAVTLKVWVHYSHHCFSQAKEKVPGADPAHFYTDTSRRDERVFCPLRWADSKDLPRILAALGGTNCYATRHHNYFVVHPTSNPADAYFIYFAASKHRAADVELRVESAYIRTDVERAKQGGQKVSFHNLLIKAWQGSTLRRRP